MLFRPQIGSTIEVNNVPLVFTPHPGAKNMPYGQRGRKAIVYQVQDDQGYFHALKVFLNSFRQPQNARGAIYLKPYAAMPALNVCNRVVLTPETHAPLLEIYQELSYAVLMPWVSGDTWFDYLIGERKTTPEQSCELATRLSGVLKDMEAAGIAHCDLSPANLIISQTDAGQAISLVDVEDMYGENFERPQPVPAGTDGYAHKTAREGLWRSSGDRFAGAVLLAEILAWCDDRARRIKFGDSFFDQGEIHQASERYQVLLRVLRERWGERAAGLFAQAWYADTLEACPTMEEWHRAISAGPGPTPEELRAEIGHLSEAGDWAQVAQKCDELMQVEGSTPDAQKWKAQAQKILAQQHEVEALRARALARGAVEDWQAALAACKTLSRLEGGREATRQKLAEAQAGLETAARLDQVDQCIERGFWKDAAVLIEPIHSDSPRCAALRARVSARMEQENASRALLSSAYTAMAEARWEEAVAACRQGLALGVEPGEFQCVLEQAVARQERHRKIASAMEQVKARMEREEWQAALSAAEQLALEYPGEKAVQDLREHARMAQRGAEKVAEAKRCIENQDFHGALGALQGVPKTFPEAERLRALTMENLSWRDWVEEARSAHDVERVLALLKSAPAGSPDLAGLEEWARNEVRLNDEAGAAQAGFDLARLAQVVAQMPEDHPRRRLAAGWLEEQRQLARKIEEARSRYDAAELRLLLLTAPAAYPQRQALLEWADRQRETQAKIDLARKLYQADRALALAESLPGDYPGRQALIDWAGALEAAHLRVEQARGGYALEEIRPLLAVLEEGDPLRAETQAWLVVEQDRLEGVNAARAAGDAALVKRLLGGAPEGFPDRAALEQWADQQIASAEALRAVYQTCDLAAGQALLERLPAGSPDRAALENWLREETARGEQIRAAQLRYQYQEVLALVGEGDPLPARLEEARQWAEGWMQAEEMIDQALEAEDQGVLDAFMDQLPADHPRSAQIRQWKEAAAQRQETLARLHASAERALRDGDYETAANACRQALVMKEAGPEFQKMLESAGQGLSKAKETRKSLQEVRELLQKGQMETALSLSRAALEQDPRSEEARSIFLRIREGIEVQAKKLDKSQKWSASLRLWRLLAEKGALPEGVRPVQRPDPFEAQAAAGEKHARGMRGKEYQRYAVIALAVILALVIIGGLIYVLASGVAMSPGGAATAASADLWSGKGLPWNPSL